MAKYIQLLIRLNIWQSAFLNGSQMPWYPYRGWTFQIYMLTPELSTKRAQPPRSRPAGPASLQQRWETHACSMSCQAVAAVLLAQGVDNCDQLAAVSGPVCHARLRS